MVLRGHVQNGVVCFDEPVALPEGAAVRVEVMDAQPREMQPQSSAERPPIEQQIGAIWGDLPPDEWAKLPRDLSDHLDHFVYGTPKK